MEEIKHVIKQIKTNNMIQIMLPNCKSIIYITKDQAWKEKLCYCIFKNFI